MPLALAPQLQYSLIWTFSSLEPSQNLVKPTLSCIITLSNIFLSRYRHHIPLHVCFPFYHFLQSKLSITPEYSVVKSRLQAGAANALKYKSSLDGLLTILQEEGVGGLYKGIGSKITQSVLTAAILFAGQRRIFEITKKVS